MRLSEKGKIKKFFFHLIHGCYIEFRDILWGGDGTQYCSYCGKEIKRKLYTWKD